MVFKGLGVTCAISAIPELCDRFDTFQVMMPESHNLRAKQRSILKQVAGLGKQVVFHADFETSVLNSRTADSWVSYLFKLVELAAEYGVKYVVAHPGPMTNFGMPLTRDVAVSRLKAVSMRLSPRIPAGVELLWENSCGKIGCESGLHSADIIGVLGQLGTSERNIGLCFDIQHYVAAGEDMDFIEHRAAYAKVIHLNANPVELSHGSRTDSHSYAPIRSSVVPRSDFFRDIIDTRPALKIMECHRITWEDNLKFLANLP